jgi:hypothetical protein
METLSAKDDVTERQGLVRDVKATTAVQYIKPTVEEVSSDDAEKQVLRLYGIESPGMLAHSVIQHCAEEPISPAIGACRYWTGCTKTSW